MRRLPPFDLPLEDQVLAFGGLEDLELVGLDPVFRREAQGGLGPGTLGIAGNLERRTGYLLDAVRLAIGEAGYVYHEPSAGPRRFDGFRLESERGKLFLEPLFQLHDEPREPGSGNLLAADLPEKGKLFHHEASTALGAGASESTYARATAHASSLTWRMFAVRSLTEIAPRESRVLKRCEHFKTCS